MKLMFRLSAGADGSRQVDVLDADDRRSKPPSAGETDIDLPVEVQMLIGSLLRRSTKPDKDKQTLGIAFALVLNAMPTAESAAA